MAKQSTTHGGQRDGSGRKRKHAETVVISAGIPSGLRDELDTWRKAEGLNRSEAIMEAIRLLLKR